MPGAKEGRRRSVRVRTRFHVKVCNVCIKRRTCKVCERWKRVAASCHRPVSVIKRPREGSMRRRRSRRALSSEGTKGKIASVVGLARNFLIGHSRERSKPPRDEQSSTGRLRKFSGRRSTDPCCSASFQRKDRVTFPFLLPKHARSQPRSHARMHATEALLPATRHRIEARLDARGSRKMMCKGNNNNN